MLLKPPPPPALVVYFQMVNDVDVFSVTSLLRFGH